MTLTDSALTFPTHFGLVVVSGLLVVITAVLAFTAWKRSRFSRSVGWLEFLRVIIVTLVALTLNQPEWRETFKPDQQPTIAILTDGTGSMQTADVTDDDDPGAGPRTREAVATAVADDTIWDELGSRFNILKQPFTSESSGATDIAGALDGILEQEPTLRALVLVSDGDWNEGNPPARAATRYRMKDIPIFAVAAGSEQPLPDLEVTAFDIPTFGIAGKPVRLPFSVKNAFSTNQAVNLTVETTEGERLSKEVIVPAFGKLSEALLWTPQNVGDFELTIEIPAQDDESNPDNNVMSAPISVRKEELKVLVIDSFPRWEYRYLRNALERDPGVEVSCLLFHPDLETTGSGPGYLEGFPDPDRLADFDVIILGDVGENAGQLTSEQALSIKRQVTTQAAGLVLMPGFRGYQRSLVETEFEDLYPVVMDTAQPRGWGSPVPGQFELTQLGSKSLLTRLEDSENANATVWSSLPGFQWYAGVLRAKPGSEVLATHSSEANRYGRIPLIATKTYGTGKILFMGTDGAWRWRKGVEDKYHYRFWGQVARWMAYQRNMASDELLRLFYSPDRPQTSDTLTLNANAMSVGGEPLQSASIVVEITNPSNRVESIRLQPEGNDQWGLFTGQFEPTVAGEHRLLVTCAENGGQLDLALTIQGREIEQIGQPARFDVMEEIAQLSRGEFLSAPDASTIASRITGLPEPELIERRLRIWSHPLWIGVIVLLMTGFWIGRKAVGSV